MIGISVFGRTIAAFDGDPSGGRPHWAHPIVHDDFCELLDEDRNAVEDGAAVAPGAASAMIAATSKAGAASRR